MSPEINTAEKRPVCEGCGREIDPDCCGCGDSKEHHASAFSAGHPFVPMGCDCLREPELTYDDIVELIVDADDTTTPWAPYQERKIVLALKELQQRRIDERVANNLASVKG